MKLKELKAITDAIPISSLSTEQAKELQTALNRLDRFSGEIDGSVGQSTKDAWEEFKTYALLAKPEMIDPISVDALQSELDIMVPE